MTSPSGRGRTSVPLLPVEAKGVPHPTTAAKVDKEPSAGVSSLNSNSSWDPPINLDHLSEEQQLIVKKMLREESGAFAQNDQDMGSIEKLQMSIKLNDATPVQRTYQSIPRPLYAEVKDYLTDLLNRGWIQKSFSNYSSPVVCVRKKDGSLRLCVDYRQLNLKTITDRQPIPRIQDMLDSLGGNKWFSTLDQGKAYHQGFMTEESHHLTAFVTLGPSYTI